MIYSVRVINNILLLLVLITACSKINQQEIYPKIIVEHGFEELYDRTKWELYKLNSLPEFGGSDFVIEYDSILESKFYSNSELALKLLSRDETHRYIECDLKFFYNEKFPIKQGDTITLSFFPTYNLNDNLTKPIGDLVHTISYVNNQVIEVRIGRRTWPINEEHLAIAQKDFTQYLSEMNDIEMSDWLQKHKSNYLDF